MAKNIVIFNAELKYLKKARVYLMKFLKIDASLFRVFTTQKLRKDNLCHDILFFQYLFIFFVNFYAFFVHPVNKYLVSQGKYH